MRIRQLRGVAAFFVNGRSTQSRHKLRIVLKCGGLALSDERPAPGEIPAIFLLDLRNH